MIGVPYIDYLPDNAAEVLASEPVMAAPCVGCPYTPGTEASQCAPTVRHTSDCTAARCAFFCHMTIKDEFPTHVCAGWLASISNTRTSGVCEGHGTEQPRTDASSPGCLQAIPNSSNGDTGNRGEVGS